MSENEILTIAPAYRLYVKFSILGSDVDFLRIDEVLQTKAKHFARKGQGLEGRPAARQNVWSYWGDGPEENAEFITQWQPIDLLIRRNKDAILKLGNSARIRVAIVSTVFSDFPEIDIPPEALREISEIGATLNFYISGSLTGEVY